MIGEKLGPFRITEKIGQGAMGVVYKATYESTGQEVAIKVVAQEQASKSNAAERFERESDILKQLKHPHIVLHVGKGTSKRLGLTYYAMEYVPGKTLESLLEERAPLPWTEVVDLGLQMCDALQYAHDRGVVHRDLKPSNLLITNKGQLKLTDFGIAKDLDRTKLTATGRTLGTAAYMAPEQITGTPEVSHKTDLYALGCLFYQMLTGSTPFEGRSAMVLMHKHLEEPAPRPSAKNPQVPLALDKLTTQLMAKNRDQRPWDAQFVAHTLAELKEKVEREEAVPMVFGNTSANPMRAPGPAPLVSEAIVTRGPTEGGSSRARKTSKGKRRSSESEVSIPDARHHLETGLLVLALVVVVGLVGYLLWPPSAAYLYRKAAEGMAKPNRSDWVLAQEHYVSELERRFPEHPYQAEVQAWKDRILLDQAEGRERFLVNPNLLAVSKPKDETEAAFQRTYMSVAKDLSEDAPIVRDEAALRSWRGLAQVVEGRAADRMWWLLVNSKAEKLESDMKDRLDAVTAKLVEADVADRRGKFAEARRLRDEAIRDYGRYQSLQPLIQTARLKLEASSAAPEEPKKAIEPAPSAP